MANIVRSFKDKYTSLMKSKANLAEKTKQTTHMFGQAGAAGGAGLLLGALDQAKGTAGANDFGVTEHKVGQVPTTAIAAAVALAGALATPFNSLESKMAMGAADSAIGITLYKTGRKLYLKHQQGSGTPSK